MKKILDPRNLPYFGALVQAVLFALAGNKLFELFPFGLLLGLGVGAVVNWSMAVASSRINDVAKARKPLAYISLLFLFCLSPIIICSTLGFTLANVTWSMAADLSILLTGSIVGKTLISQEARTPTKSARTPTKSVHSARKYPRKCAYCAEMLRSPNAVGGHMKKNHPQLCKGALAENLFQLKE